MIQRIKRYSKNLFLLAWHWIPRWQQLLIQSKTRKFSKTIIGTGVKKETYQFHLDSYLKTPQCASVSSKHFSAGCTFSQACSSCKCYPATGWEFQPAFISSSYFFPSTSYTEKRIPNFCTLHLNSYLKTPQCTGVSSKHFQQATLFCEPAIPASVTWPVAGNSSQLSSAQITSSHLPHTLKSVFWISAPPPQMVPGGLTYRV